MSLIKKIILFLLILVFLAQPLLSVSGIASQTYYHWENPDFIKKIKIDLSYDLENRLDEEYHLDDVSVIYLSQEYLDELYYNSLPNLFFGYTLKEIYDQYAQEKFIFTVDSNGNTIVQKFEEYDDTYEKVIRNVAIGSGVILVCVTVSVVTGGLAAPGAVAAGSQVLTNISLVFAAAAKTGTIMALEGGAFGGVVSGITTGIKTKDFDETIKASALGASSGFKWGAIAGAAVGATSEIVELQKLSVLKEEKLVESSTLTGHGPNETYVSNGYTYTTDELARPISGGGKLRLESGIRDQAAQLNAGGVDRLLGDQGGHLIGRQFGGSGTGENLVAMSSNLNQGVFARLETKWRQLLETGHEVIVNVKPAYSGLSLRPYQVVVEETLDGVFSEYVLANTIPLK